MVNMKIFKTKQWPISRLSRKENDERAENFRFAESFLQHMSEYHSLKQLAAAMVAPYPGPH
jgi:hypothetical protein